RLRLLHQRMPVRHSQVQHPDKESLQVHALRRSCFCGPGTRVHQGLPDQLPPVWRQGPDASGGPETCGPAKRGWVRVCFDLRSARRGRNGRHHRARTGRPPRSLRPAEKPDHPLGRAALEDAAQMDRQPGHDRRGGGHVHPLSALWAEADPGKRSVPLVGGETMGESRVLPGGRILRYTVTERLVHSVSGLSYVYLLLNGLALWSPWMWWIAALLGGGPMARATHPWVGLVFVASLLYMYQLWGRDMRITDKDLEWKKTLGQYVRNQEEELDPVT